MKNDEDKENDDFDDSLSQCSSLDNDNGEPNTSKFATATQPSFAVSKRQQKLHSLADGFLSRLTASKQSGNCSSSDPSTSGVRKSLKKFVFGSSEDERPVSKNMSESSLSESNGRMDIHNPESAQLEQGIDKKEMISHDTESTCQNFSVSSKGDKECDALICYDDDVEHKRFPRKVKVVKFNLDDLRLKLKSHLKDDSEAEKKEARNFHAKIAPSDNQTAEAELTKVLKKEMFAKVSSICLSTCFIQI